MEFQRYTEITIFLHVIISDKNSLYSRTTEQFDYDVVLLYNSRMQAAAPNFGNPIKHGIYCRGQCMRKSRKSVENRLNFVHCHIKTLQPGLKCPCKIHGNINAEKSIHLKTRGGIHRWRMDMA